MERKKLTSISGDFLNRKDVAPYVFLLPFIVFFAVFRLWPIIWSFVISFCSYSGSGIEFVGLHNYVDLFKDRIFRTAVWNTFYFVIAYNIIMISLAVALAVIVNSPGIRGRRVYRSIYFIPIAMTLPVVAIVFDMIFARNIGLVSNFFGIFGGEYNLRLFADMDLAMWGVIIMRVWRGMGYYCAYFLAGLTSIPKEVYESVDIDGAGPIKTFFHITLPLLKPMLMFVTIMSTILSFQLFDEPWILTQGGPANKTLTMQIYLYKSSFLEGNMGKGSAVSYVMTLIMIVFSILQVRRMSEDEGKGKKKNLKQPGDNKKKGGLLID